MAHKIKLTIGEFSKFCQVTVKTIRHYEKLGLLVPNEVDEWTKYRYYDSASPRARYPSIASASNTRRNTRRER